MASYKNITVLGDGGWGTTLAILLERKGLSVCLWSAFESYAKVLERTRRNPNYLKGVVIPKGVRITSDMGRALQPADLIIVAVPSKYLRGVLLKAKEFFNKNVPVVSAVKGIEERTCLRMSEVIRQALSPKHLCVISGPTIAPEAVREVPTTAVVAAHDRALAESVQELFSMPHFRIYTNEDVVGVELGGSLKNVIAIACGISDGLGFGTNAKAAIVSRGLAEMSRLGVAMGARKETFAGISGLGDLVTTCFNSLSRNHSVGEKIGRGHSLKEATGHMKMVAEGVLTARSAYALSKKFKVETPIINETYRVLFKNKSPLSAVERLMMRERRSE